MKVLTKSIDSQGLLWETTTIECPAILNDEQLRELKNLLMEMLLSNLSATSAKAATTGGASNGE